MVQAVLTGRSVGSGFDIEWFSSLSSEHLCILDFVLLCIKNVSVTFFTLHFRERSVVGLALDLVD